ncbi:glycoside hydrolase family 73 protein [Companilactobacillus futsaii]|uniref:glycoside hydrolase family 73 protein n=1 Tax=Companilactobacillus futsaii TaxID=938155 RepID=UPI00189FD1E0|nr:glycoside hydrolase family 73 protein [Companilactobacillus futsaii]
MSKKNLLTSALVLGTLAATATPSVVSAATTEDASQAASQAGTEQVNNKSEDNKTNIIAGTNEKKADTTVANSATVQAASESVANASKTTAIIQAASGVTQAQQQAFLNTAVPMAQKAASQYGVYTSVMLAQAILESAWGTSTLATQGHNLFGIKGDYNGAYVTMPTSEWSASQGWYTINANFRKYPSYYESFADNGNKLRNGVSWNSSYYSGTWKENTSSYKDATAWLQGRYATAPNYASSLNNLIQTYNLTQYDGNAETNGGSQTNSNTISVNNTNGSYVPLVAFNSDGSAKKITNRALANNTPWYTDQTKSYNGHTYYRVATNEWVEDTYLA